MANLLKMAIIDTILTLHQRGWSQRRIARELGIDRETVGRHLRLARQAAKPAIAPIAIEASPDPSKPAIAPIAADAESPRLGRLSDCLPFRDRIIAWLDQGLSAQRIYQDLVRDHGFTGSYYSVRRFVRRLEGKSELPVRRLECGSGEEAQVDFGTGAPIIDSDGKRRRTHVFRIVLSHSRKAYSEAVYRQSTDDFLRCLENAFAHFGGVPQRVVLDNLKAAVHKADWFDPELNPKVQSFAQHYGTVLWPTRPYTPQHKGKVERGIDYVQDNALKGRTFACLEEENAFLLDWERTVADARMHGTIRQHVGTLFAEVERPALARLPIERFPCFHEAQRIVHRDGHVEVDRAYYSVPPEYLGRRVWVRWDGRLVRVFNHQMQQIAVHGKHEPGRFSTQVKHIVNEKISSIERGAAWLLERVRRIGPHSSRWAEAMMAVRGVEGIRVLQGLLSLANRHASVAIERACEIAHSHGAYRLRTVRQLIDRDAPRQQTIEFTDQHELIRPLSTYAQFVHNVFQKGASS